MIVGAIYWRNPTNEKEMRRAPAANNNKGVAVAAPAPMSKSAVPGPCVKKAPPAEEAPLTNKNKRANGLMRSVSIVKPAHAPTGTVFFINP